MKKYQGQYEQVEPFLSSDNETFRRLMLQYESFIDKLNDQPKDELLKWALTGYEAAFNALGWNVLHVLVDEKEIEY
jgi:hypothetical protein